MRDLAGAAIGIPNALEARDQIAVSHPPEAAIERPAAELPFVAVDDAVLGSPCPARPLLPIGRHGRRLLAGPRRAGAGGCRCSLRHRHHIGSVNRSEEHTSELQSLMRISYAVFSLK